jgi:serine/threonine protein kinase/Tfp pilus assembly protein PilF
MAPHLLFDVNVLNANPVTVRLRKTSPLIELLDSVPIAAEELLEASAVAFHADHDEQTAEYRGKAPSGRHEQVQLFRDLHDTDPRTAERLAQAVLAMPIVGSRFVGFRLLAELGRGGFARVYLAQQGDLANRPVVVKVAADVWGEAHTLAQLQHPNIVPVYSVHHEDPFQVVCMPYVGWTTFQDVLRTVQGSCNLPTTGSALLKAFKRTPPVAAADADASETTIAAAAFAHSLAGMSYVEAVVWLGARLVGGLVHAYERGIVHHDLKPANILLSDAGEPMLLDFNAAEDTKRQADGMIAHVTGTLPYMAPERLEFIRSGTGTVDARSDLYALGVILFELLTGRYPFKYRHAPDGIIDERIIEDRLRSVPRLRPDNPAVSPALEAIVRRCLEPDPERRYASALELQEDLQRQHDHLPLLHVPEPSLKERGRKWMRRHPRLLTAALAGALASVLLAGLGIMYSARGQRLDEWRQQEQVRTQKQLESEQARTAWQSFADDLKTAQFLLYTRTNEPAQLDAGTKLGLRLADDYHVSHDPAWQQASLVRALPAGDQEQLGEAMGELLLLVARGLHLQQGDVAETAERQELLTRALVLNERAVACSARAAASPALWRQRADLYAALGRKDDADASRARSEALPLQTAADHYWLASDQIAAGKLREALPLLEKAARLEPQNFWAWFVLANCQDRLGADARAAACYGVCIALRPSFHWAHFNRGLALLRQQDYGAASADFDATIRLRPELAEAYLNRALARQGLQQFQKAESDLTEALARGGASRLCFLRARVRERLGDKEGASRDLEEGLRQPPQDEISWLTRGYYLLGRDPKAALADFEQALRLNPRSADALQNKAHVLAEKLARNEDALAVLNRALDLYPDSVKARGGRGVLYARLGQREPALRDADEVLLRDTSPLRFYQVACIYALTSRQHPEDRPRALQLLSTALRRGYGFDLLESDHDLDPLRPLPEFRRLVAAARTLQPRTS